ncbi:VPA1269 family protein [Rhizobium johnstonii]|uniref:VPA1269 family protein n=1 Tax=Rhizobium johnstonii TaxID=3019933 RepID=UPI003F9BA904
MKKIRGTEVSVNLTSRHMSRSTNGAIDPKVVEAIAALKSFPMNKPLTIDIQDKIDLLINSDVCLSPTFFFDKDARPSKLVVLEMVSQAELGAQMWEALRDDGAFDFLEGLHPSNQSNYTSEIARIVAVFALCTIGEDEFSKLPLQAIHAVVDYFRSDNGRRWRGELWGVGEAGFQCMREVVLSLARIRDDPTLAEKSGQDREDVGALGRTKRAWAVMCASADPLNQELTRRYADYDQIATDSPAARKQMVLDLRAYFDCVGAHGTLAEILGQKDRKTTYQDFLAGRVGKVTNYVMRNAGQARRFVDFVIEQLEEENPGAVFYSLVTQRDLDVLKNEVEDTQSKRKTTASRPLPGKLHAIAKAILDEGEDGWPGQSGYFHEFVEIRGKRRKIYCPVIPTLLRTAMDLPLRMVQLRRLDSGEGDLEMFNGDAMKWEPNTSPLAGYWKRQKGAK